MTKPQHDQESRQAGEIAVDNVLALLDVAAGGQPDGSPGPAEILAQSNVPPAAVVRIDAAVHRLQMAGEHRRRRGQELTALFSSARELAQLRDVDTLLERLVERAHDLVGTDVTYLSEFHPESRELRVRNTLGTTAPTFRNLRVPPGKGLASMVVDSRSPHWTPRYSSMLQAPHDVGIDAAVAAEGLVSLLGVPLLAGDEVIGVLFAANRVEHDFTPDEISLLSAFADHAAVVLQTAQLLAQARRSHEAAQHAYEELARHLEATERSSTVHEELTAIVLRGGNADEVAAALGHALHCTVTVLNDELRQPPRGQVGHGDSTVPTDVRAAVDESRRSGHCVVLPRARGQHRAVVAVVAGSTFLGALKLDSGALAFGPVERRTAERAAQITALLTLKQDAIIDAEQRVRGDLLADLLSEDRTRWHNLAARAKSRRVDVDKLRMLVATAVGVEHRRTALTAAGRAAGPYGLAGEYMGRIVVLTDGDDPEAAARLVHEAIHRALPVPVLAAAVRLTEEPADVRGQFRAAEGILRVLPALGLHDVAVTVDEYLPYAALFGPDSDRVEAFVNAAIGPLLDRDQGRAGHLLSTLAAYIDSRLSPVGTARVLHLHKNTVLQRLDRVSELLGSDWQNPERLFRISVAVRISMLRTANE